MNELYPLKFHPIFKDKIWGGSKLKTLLDMDFSPLSNCGEAWLLSTCGREISEVQNGFLKGNNLKELLEIYMGDLVGEKVFDHFGEEFPLLIKLIDATDWLSVQVHPDDVLAKRIHQGSGKTEMWYVMHAEPGSELISGFNQKMTPEQYQQHLQNGTLTDILNFVNPQQGDVYYIPAGRIHAMGPGLLIAEIQQTSDFTYRVFDWNRMGTDGKPRELHTELALQAIDFEYHETIGTPYILQPNQTVPVVKNTYFDTGILQFGTSVVKDYTALDSFVILFGVQGNFELEHNNHKELVKTGEVILIPAETGQIRLHPLSGEAKLLEIYVP